MFAMSGRYIKDFPTEPVGSLGNLKKNSLGRMIGEKIRNFELRLKRSKRSTPLLLDC